MPSYTVEYQVKNAVASVVVEADDPERAVHAAIEQAAVPEGGEIQVYKTILMPAEEAEAPPPERTTAASSHASHHRSKRSSE